MKEWIYPQEDAFDEYRDAQEITAGILRRRGIEGEEALAEYLSASPKQTYDPFLMKDMKAAVIRIVEALRRQEKICVYGDYDADGVTATSLLLTVLGRLTKHLIYYIPSRFDEGYGLNKEAVRLIAEQGVKLLITVDCGSVSCEEVALAGELGLSVIVTDHHSMNGRQAVDCLLLNPKREDCGYPFKELCGCGVAFKLTQALQRTLKRPDGTPVIDKKLLNSLLDLVAIGTIGDIVSLQDENRTLVKYGMNILNRNQRPGLAMLLSGVKLTPGQVTSEQVAFVIVPHLNAAGRMMSAKTGVELLTLRPTDAKQQQEMQRLVETLVENNRQRKRVQEETFQRCMEILQQEGETKPGQAPKQEQTLFQVIEVRDAHEGITGIVAGKIKDATGKPTIIVTASGDGLLKGTGRSIPGVNLYQLLSGCQELFLRYGGHAGACGFLMKEDNLTLLRESLNQQMTVLVEETPGLLIPKVHIDAVVTGAQLSHELIEQLQRMAPFGQGNPKPVLAVNDVCVSRLGYMGERKQHVRFTARTEEETTFECVLFQRAQELGDLLFEDSFVSVAGSAEVNSWNGVQKVQFLVSDVQ